MTWIKTVPPSEVDEKLRDAKRNALAGYPPEYGADVDSLRELASRSSGGGISDSHSLIPDALYHAFSTLRTLLSPDLPLSRKQHEMIATTVSVLNHCFY